MELKAGTLDDFDDSMAAAMEKAFEKVWLEHMGYELPTQTQDDRRILFVAIAQGMVRHLKDYSVDGFDVDVSVQQTDTGPFIDSTGTVTAGNTVDVTQTNAAGNRIQSEGKGVVNIKFTGELYP